MSKGEGEEGELMTLDYILDTLKADLIKRGKLQKNQEISRLDLALLILDTYSQYPPPPNSLIPINYCMLGKLYPWTDTLFSLIC